MNRRCCTETLLIRHVSLLATVSLLMGCFPQAVPLATLPIVAPEAAALNLRGIDHYHKDEWGVALDSFQSALDINSDLVEAHFNAALTLHQLGRHQEATQYFQRAGALDPTNASIVESTLYRNHLGLSSMLERHLSGGYRYQWEGEKGKEETENKQQQINGQ